MESDNVIVMEEGQKEENEERAKSGGPSPPFHGRWLLTVVFLLESGEGSRNKGNRPKGLELPGRTLGDGG